MAFLYGDSSESGLELNYIEFLKAALDFAVQVLLADHRVQTLHQGAEDRRGAAEDEVDELRQLGEQVARVLEAPPGPPDGAAARCAAALRTTAQDAVKKATGMVKAQLTEKLNAIAQQIGRERQVAGRALEAFLLQHDLPGATRHLDLALEPGGQRYAATLRGKADVGLEWLLGLAIPDDHAFGQVLKLERVAPQLEIRVPETGGFLRKGVRMKTVRLGGHHLIELSHAGAQTTFKLRVQPQEDEAGLNVLVSAAQPGAPTIRLVRVAKGGEHSPPFEPLDEDAPRLAELAAQLRLDLGTLAERRRALIEARLDGKPLAEHEGPSVAVRRLIARIAPVVQEIARRSLSPDELVLKRVLADDRREEIFVARADLEAKLEPVPPALRALFLPLGLGGAPPAVTIEAEPGEPDPRATARAATGDVEVEVDGETKELYIGRASEAAVDVDHPTSVQADDDDAPHDEADDEPAEPPIEPRLVAASDAAHAAFAAHHRPPAASDAAVATQPVPRIAEEPPPREAPRELPRASEVFRRNATVPTGAPPMSDDEDITAVGVAPPKPPAPRKPPTVPAPAAPPPAPPPADSIDVALNELERDSD